METQKNVKNAKKRWKIKLKTVYKLQKNGQCYVYKKHCIKFDIFQKRCHNLWYEGRSNTKKKGVFVYAAGT